MAEYPKIQIYFVVPREEERYQKIFNQGKTWHNNLWQTASKFKEISTHFEDIVKELKRGIKSRLEKLDSEKPDEKKRLEEELAKKLEEIRNLEKIKELEEELEDIKEEERLERHYTTSDL